MKQQHTNTAFLIQMNPLPEPWLPTKTLPMSGTQIATVAKTSEYHPSTFLSLYWSLMNIKSAFVPRIRRLSATLLLCGLPCGNFIFFDFFFVQYFPEYKVIASPWEMVYLVWKNFGRFLQSLFLCTGGLHCIHTAFCLVSCSWPAGDHSQSTCNSVGLLLCVDSAIHPANSDTLGLRLITTPAPLTHPVLFGEWSQN